MPKKKRITSAASSRTKFMYSSNPTMCPSILVLIFSYNQTWTRVRFCKENNKNHENHEGYPKKCFFFQKKTRENAPLIFFQKKKP